MLWWRMGKFGLQMRRVPSRLGVFPGMRLSIGKKNSVNWLNVWKLAYLSMLTACVRQRLKVWIQTTVWRISCLCTHSMILPKSHCTRLNTSWFLFLRLHFWNQMPLFLLLSRSILHVKLQTHRHCDMDSEISCFQCKHLQVYICNLHTGFHQTSDNPHPMCFILNVKQKSDPISAPAETLDQASRTENFFTQENILSIVLWSLGQQICSCVLEQTRGQGDRVECSQRSGNK